VFELSQDLRRKWLTAGFGEKRRLLNFVCSNLVLEGATLVISTRRRFNCVVEGLSVSDSGEGGAESGHSGGRQGQIPRYTPASRRSASSLGIPISCLSRCFLRGGRDGNGGPPGRAALCVWCFAPVDVLVIAVRFRMGAGGFRPTLRASAAHPRGGKKFVPGLSRTNSQTKHRCDALCDRHMGGDRSAEGTDSVVPRLGDVHAEFHYSCLSGDRVGDCRNDSSPRSASRACGLVDTIHFYFTARTRKEMTGR
jgi:hypothetical protein